MATLNLILLGDANVGKTSIINKYVKGVFYEKPMATVGVDFAYKQITKEELKNAGNTNSTCSEMQFAKGADEQQNILKDSIYGGATAQALNLSESALITGEDVNM